MRRTIPLFALVLAVLAAPLRAAERGEDALRRDIEFARLKVYPALVNISVVVREYGGGRAQKMAGAGSGVIVSPAGHVLTNYHVAGNTMRILCTLPSRESIEAAVVAHDPLTDISVLQLRMETRKDPNIPLPFASLGDSDALRVGDYVLAMGNPLSLSSSMTLGIVSNPRRVFTSFTGSDMDEMELAEGQSTGLFTRWIQHDALILPGNSGGPLVNLQGEVVGINELGGNGVGFAIPSNLVAHVLNQALTYGEVRRGTLGIAFYPVLKLDRADGALVASVAPGGPGEAVGVQAGDVLLAIDGEPVSARFFEEIPLLYKRVADLAPGARARLTLVRGEAVLTLTVEVGRMEPSLGDEREFRTWGLSARGITAAMAQSRRYPDAKGALVTGLRAGYPADAAKPSLNPGDVIRALGGVAVDDIATFAARAEELARDKAKEVLVAFRRGDQDLLTVVDLSRKEPEPQGGELPQAWVGIETQVLTTDVAKALGLKGRKGFRVTQVFPGTEAEKGGLKTGDVVLALNGAPLKASRLQDSELLRRRVENLVIGTKAKFTVLRDGAETQVEVLLQETPGTAEEAKTARADSLELTVRDLTFMDRIRNKWTADQAGVLVSEVVSGGWASLAGLRARDLILTIDGRAVADVKDFKALVKDIEEGKPERIRVFVRRGTRTAFVFLEPDWGRETRKD